MDLAPDRPVRPRRPARPRPDRGRARWAGLVLILAPWVGLAPAGESPGPASGDGDSAKARVAAVPPESIGPRKVLDITPAGRPAPTDHAGTDGAEAIARACRMIADCKARYEAVHDYKCTFFKRERVDGKVYNMHVMEMKARARPSSLYFKFVQPNAGREVIYIEGRNGGKILAHDVGIGRVVAGTMRLDPRGDMAMEENRHPVTEAGLGSLIATVHDRWAADLTPENARVIFHARARVGDRSCTMIETIHPHPGPRCLFHKVKLFIDDELGIPIRFEAFDWPAHAGAEPPLMEEYSYMNLRLNVGLKERDFDQKNAQYSFGRF